MLAKILFCAGGILYGAVQFYFTSKVSLHVIKGEIGTMMLCGAAKLLLYGGLVLFVLLFRQDERIWVLGGYGAGLCVPAVVYAGMYLSKKGDGDHKHNGNY